MSTLFSHFFCLFLKIVSVSLKTRHSMFSPAHKYGILRQKEVCRLKDNRIHFDLERKLRRYAISDLMKYIVIGQGIVFALLYIWPTLGYQLYSLITLTRTGLMRGQIWRLVTFVFVPAYSSPFSLLISLYFYYWIGSTLERQWGTAKFNLYYFSGMLLTVLGAVLASLITGNYYLTVAGTNYVNLSMFFAFAVLFPNAQVLLFFIIPVKMKWLAYLDGALFAFDIISAVGQHNWGGVVLPIVALLNFAVFIWPEVHYLRQRTQYQASRKTVQFRQAQQQQARQQEQQGYHHKCAVCGKTDTDYPDMQFRYCSKCAGYHCFCQDHIFNHVHFTEE